MSQTGVQLVIGRLMIDPDFRRRYEQQAEGCLVGLCAQGIALSEEEIALLVGIDPRLWSKLAARLDPRLRRPLDADRQASGLTSLTARERQVLDGVCEGLTNKEIGSRLGVSEGAVKATVQQLFRKSHVRSRAQLVRIALEQATRPRLVNLK